MSETTWMAGPWRVDRIASEPIVVAGNDGWYIASLPKANGTQEANARLIAAAPALYEALGWSTVALENIVKHLPAGVAEEVRDEIAKNRAALSAARGGSDV